MTNVKLIACVGLTFLTAGCYSYEGPTEDQIETAVSESLRSLDTPRPSPLGPQSRNDSWAAFGSLENKLRKVKSKEDCKKQSDILYACHIDIFMSLRSSLSLINPNPISEPYSMFSGSKTTTTMNFVYRDGAWHVADEHKGWFGKLVIKEIFNSIGISVMEFQ